MDKLCVVVFFGAMLLMHSKSKLILQLSFPEKYLNRLVSFSVSAQNESFLKFKIGQNECVRPDGNSFKMIS